MMRMNNTVFINSTNRSIIKIIYYIIFVNFTNRTVMIQMVVNHIIRI